MKRISWMRSLLLVLLMHQVAGDLSWLGADLVRFESLIDTEIDENKHLAEIPVQLAPGYNSVDVDQ